LWQPRDALVRCHFGYECPSYGDQITHGYPDETAAVLAMVMIQAPTMLVFADADGAASRDAITAVEMAGSG
jgi:hypothetical protein